MKRVFKTIATPECEAGLRDMVKSAQAHGWTEPVYVYTTSPKWNPIIEGVIMRYVDAWWPEDSEIGTCRNAPALIKPDLFLDTEPGDVVLYVDAADVLFMREPDKLFRLFEKSAAAIAARPFRTDRRVGHDHPVIKGLLGEDLTNERSDYVNSGVILARHCDETWWTMKMWKLLLGYTHFAGPWKIGSPQNKLVGDQEAFNVALRILCRRNDSALCRLPPSWNYRGATRVERNLTEREGRVICPFEGVIHLVHCSGLGSMPEWIRKLTGAA
jgi:hypothetical protein